MAWKDASISALGSQSSKTCLAASSGSYDLFCEAGLNHVHPCRQIFCLGDSISFLSSLLLGFGWAELLTVLNTATQPGYCLLLWQAQQRELTVRHVKETEKELSHQLTLQREQYEAAIQRHLAFIDQVMASFLLLQEGPIPCPSHTISSLNSLGLQACPHFTNLSQK